MAMKIVLFAILICLLGMPAESSEELEFQLVTGSEREKETEKQVKRLLAQYELEPWLFTRRVSIESGVIPHSHPVLTLNTRYHLGDDLGQLATFLHEQIHWYLVSDDVEEQFANAINRLKLLYPEVPPHDELGTRSEESTYLHLLVNWLELDALRQLIGEEQARNVITTKNYYTWIYTRVLEDDERIREIVSREGLVLDAD